MTTSGIDRREALELIACEGPELLELIARAGRTRLERRGDEVVPCAIINAKCGLCSQDCAFCAQSARSTAEIERFPLKPTEVLVAESRAAAEMGACRIGLVTSGKSVKPGPELETIAGVIEVIAAELPSEPCASLGVLDRPALERLRDAGLTRYHHNLETAESFFREVCTTRSWRESVDTAVDARAAGLAVCCGGIFGLGESPAQRVELLATLAELELDSIPLNFLHPIPGTPLGERASIPALECVKVVAVARLMMPDREVRVCGGRERNMRDLQSWALLAGADGLMIGGYLTTTGRTVADDLRMVRDAGFRVATRSRGT
jgi:biotin synthase